MEFELKEKNDCASCGEDNRSEFMCNACAEWLRTEI